MEALDDALMIQQILADLQQEGLLELEVVSGERRYYLTHAGQLHPLLGDTEEPLIYH
jgi:hypothetical protein